MDLSLGGVAFTSAHVSLSAVVLGLIKDIPVLLLGRELFVVVCLFALIVFIFFETVRGSLKN